MNLAQALQGDSATRLERRLLLEAVVDRNHAWILSHPEYLLSATETDAYMRLLERRASGEPIAYLLGRREFFGLDLAVTPAVLIPRPETEGLVTWALELLDRNASFPVLDLGTGSGAIAIALQAQRPTLRITAVDASTDALALARANAVRLTSASEKTPIEFLHSHWFDALGERRFGLILSNPPYVAEDDPHLTQGDLRFEPRRALCAGPDGQEALRTIAARAPQYLHPGGFLLLEHGYDQGPACTTLLKAAGFQEISTRLDLSGQARLTGGCLPTATETGLECAFW